jgi:hypothetical protein
MKKTILLISFATFFSLASFAQDSTHSMKPKSSTMSKKKWNNNTGSTTDSTGTTSPSGMPVQNNTQMKQNNSTGNLPDSTK